MLVGRVPPDGTVAILVSTPSLSIASIEIVLSPALTAKNRCEALSNTIPSWL
jgi:hypothetical protein